MKITLKEKPEHIELIKLIGSRDEDESKRALKIFANLVGPLAKRVLDETNYIDSLYSVERIGEFDTPTIPLDDYFDVDEADYVRVTFSSNPGSLAYSQVYGGNDLAVSTFTLTAAVAMYTKYLRAGRLSHASNAIRKLINEVRFKTKTQAIQPILHSIATAEGSNPNYPRHVIRAENPSQFGLKDFNKLSTLASRIVTSALGGTPEGSVSRGITDLLVSPEIVEEIRGIAYQPVNTRPGYVGADEDTSVGIPAHEDLRRQIYNSAGVPSIYNTNIIELNELGIGERFNTFFAGYAGATQYGGSAFNPDSEELLIALNRSFTPNGLVKVELADGELNSTFTVRPDDQFVAREKKVGFYGESEQGYVAVEPRNLFGIIV